jgi:hypothetical protein
MVPVVRASTTSNGAAPASAPVSAASADESSGSARP